MNTDRIIVKLRPDANQSSESNIGKIKQRMRFDKQALLFAIIVVVVLVVVFAIKCCQRGRCDIHCPIRNHVRQASVQSSIKDDPPCYDLAIEMPPDYAPREDIFTISNRVATV